MMWFYQYPTTVVTYQRTLITYFVSLDINRYDLSLFIFSTEVATNIQTWYTKKFQTVCSSNVITGRAWEGKWNKMKRAVDWNRMVCEVVVGT